MRCVSRPPSQPLKCDGYHVPAHFRSRVCDFAHPYFRLGLSFWAHRPEDKCRDPTHSRAPEARPAPSPASRSCGTRDSGYRSYRETRPWDVGYQRAVSLLSCLLGHAGRPPQRCPGALPPWSPAFGFSARLRTRTRSQISLCCYTGLRVGQRTQQLPPENRCTAPPWCGMLSSGRG